MCSATTPAADGSSRSASLDALDWPTVERRRRRGDQRRPARGGRHVASGPGHPQAPRLASTWSPSSTTRALRTAGELAGRPGLRARIARPERPGADDSAGAARRDCPMSRPCSAETAVAQDIARRARLQPGSVRGGWLRWAQATLRPQLDWRSCSAPRSGRSAAAVAGAADYSYARPPRRRVPQSCCRPLRWPLARVAVIIDTSGSVSDECPDARLDRGPWLPAGTGVRRDLLTVYSADTAGAQADRPDEPDGDPDRRWRHRHGGGDRTCSRRRPRPDLVIVITDGLTPGRLTRPGRAAVVALFPSPDHDATARRSPRRPGTRCPPGARR